MRTIIHSALLVTLISQLLAPAGKAQGTSLQGVVEDADGNAVEAAQVILTRDAGESRERVVKSDKSGHFIFEDVAVGDYLVYARKEESGFPDTMFAFFGIGQPKPMRIAIQETVSPVIVRIGKPDGFLSCTVTDQTGRPVPGAQYRLYPEENPGMLIISGADKDGKIHTPVPGVPVILQMEAAGYQQWRSDPILITGGETKLLSIKLTALPTHQ
jgi:hypothetical protein